MKVSAIYDVAISFAGEDRPFAEAIASGLTTKGLNVFYDAYEEAELWGKDLYVHFTKIYSDDSKFCLMLLSHHYATKQWTSHERRAAQSRAFGENREYIIPLRLDDTKVDGILGTVGYIDSRNHSLEKIIELVVKKVRSFNLENGIKSTLVCVEEVFNNAGIKNPNGPNFSDADFETKCPTCKAKQRLSEAALSLDGDDTIYTCRNGCQPIVVISRPGIVVWPGRGYRLGSHVVRNASDIVISISNVANRVLVPASPAALMKNRPFG